MQKFDAMGMFSLFFSRSLANKSRFGAVLEEFEVRDALEKAFYAKQDIKMAMNGY